MLYLQGEPRRVLGTQKPLPSRRGGFTALSSRESGEVSEQQSLPSNVA